MGGTKIVVLRDVVALNIPNTTDDLKCQSSVTHVHTLHEKREGKQRRGIESF